MSDSSAISANTDNSSLVTVSVSTAGSIPRMISTGLTIIHEEIIKILSRYPEEIVSFLQYRVPIVFGKISEKSNTAKVKIADATPIITSISVSSAYILAT